MSAFATKHPSLTTPYPCHAGKPPTPQIHASPKACTYLIPTGAGQHCPLVPGTGSSSQYRGQDLTPRLSPSRHHPPLPTRLHLPPKSLDGWQLSLWGSRSVGIAGTSTLDKGTMVGTNLFPQNIRCCKAQQKANFRSLTESLFPMKTNTK